jgi:hypothetical protein
MQSPWGTHNIPGGGSTVPTAGPANLAGPPPLPAGSSSPVRRVPQAVLDQINQALAGSKSGQGLDPGFGAGAGVTAPRFDVKLPAFVPHQAAPRFTEIPNAKPGEYKKGAAEIPNAPKGALAEAFYDPLGSWDNGRFGGPIGHHSDHVHLSITNPLAMLAAIQHAQSMGLHVGENPYVDHVNPVHSTARSTTKTSPGGMGGGRSARRSTCPATRRSWPRSIGGRLRTCGE